MCHTADLTACELSVDGSRNATGTQPKHNRNTTGTQTERKRNATADDIKLELDSPKAAVDTKAPEKATVFI